MGSQPRRGSIELGTVEQRLPPMAMTGAEASMTVPDTSP